MVEVRGRETGKLDQWLGGRFGWITVLAATLLAVATISPVLSGGFQGDDAWASVRSGRDFLALSHTSVFQQVWSDQMAWVTGNGRFFPLSSYGGFLFYLVNGNAFAYKAFIVALVAINLLLFRVFVIKVTHSRALGLFAILLPPLFFQVRYADDPLTSYQGLMQVVVLWM